MSFFYLRERGDSEEVLHKVENLSDNMTLKEFYRIILQQLGKPPIAYFSNRYRLYTGTACISGFLDEEKLIGYTREEFGISWGSLFELEDFGKR